MGSTMRLAVKSTLVYGVETLVHLITRIAVFMRMEIGVQVITNVVCIITNAVKIIQVLGVNQLIHAVYMMKCVVNQNLFKDIGATL